jgi:hypothetical protein
MNPKVAALFVCAVVCSFGVSARSDPAAGASALSAPPATSAAPAAVVDLPKTTADAAASKPNAAPTPAAASSVSIPSATRLPAVIARGGALAIPLDGLTPDDRVSVRLDDGTLATDVPTK